MARTVRLALDSFPAPPAMDTAVSHALLRLVSDGDEPETLRLHRPAAIVAFGPADRLAPGYGKAVEAARGLGFEPVQRLAGGRAAVFHPGTIAFSWIRPDPAPRMGIRARFEELAGLMTEAFRSLGVDARMGEVPGEYCPGAYSVNAGGRTKLMGVGQRLVSRAAHVGGVIVVSGADRVREALIPVYDALGLPWNPATVGSLRDEVAGVTWEGARDALLRSFAERFRLEESPISPQALEAARHLVPRHAIQEEPTQS